MTGPRNRPLTGRWIIVTDAGSFASANEGPRGATLAQRLREAGAEVIEMRVASIEALDPRPLRDALARLPEYHWAIFTSQNAVAIFWDELKGAKLDAHATGGVKLAAVGPATAEALRSRGLPVEVTPDRFVAEELLVALSERPDIAGARILYPCAEGSRDVLRNGLRALGATVDAVPVYRSTPYDGFALTGGAGLLGGDGVRWSVLRRQLDAGRIDLVTFTSASAVRAFVGLIGAESAAKARAASIGPVTSAAAAASGLQVEIEAQESTIPGLTAAVISALTHRARRPGAASS